MESLRDLAAGVICAGFDESVADAIPQCRNLPLAGFVLFSRNADSVGDARRLSDALRKIYKDLPPILAIDQEGGRVARLREQAVGIPSAQAIGETRRPELAQRAGAQIGHDLRRAGINLDFAPVLDLALLSDNTVIGSRAFSSDPDVVTELGRAFANGLSNSGIVPTFKHFPGHGSTAVDSHYALPVVEADEETLRLRDLVPFARLLPDADVVMTAHIIFKAFDLDRPATLSAALLTDLLRKRVRFPGVCFTDCMQMDAIAQSVGSEEGAVQALIAGADCILISNSLELARKTALAIEKAVESERLPLDRLGEAYSRVKTLRRKLSEPLPLDAAAPDPDIGKAIERAAAAA